MAGCLAAVRQFIEEHILILASVLGFVKGGIGIGKERCQVFAIDGELGYAYAGRHRAEHAVQRMGVAQEALQGLHALFDDFPIGERGSIDDEFIAAVAAEVTNLLHVKNSRIN